MYYRNYSKVERDTVSSFREIVRANRLDDELRIEPSGFEVNALLRAGQIVPDPAQGAVSRFFQAQWILNPAVYPNRKNVIITTRSVRK